MFTCKIDRDLAVSGPWPCAANASSKDGVGKETDGGDRTGIGELDILRTQVSRSTNAMFFMLSKRADLA